jgi:uncharacterized membrane protein HdeD (DUF308 family)
VILSLFILLYIGPAVFALIVIISVILLAIGIERVAIGIVHQLSRFSRFVNIGFGLLIIGFSIFLMQFPIFTFGLLIFLGAIALFLSGVSRMVQGIRSNASRRFRVLGLAVGAISIAFSVIVMVHPVSVGFPSLAIIMSIAFLIIGIEMIAVGITGRSRDRIIS